MIGDRARTHFAFWRRDDGAVTVESILWIFFFMCFFALMVDASLVFHHKTGISRVVHDANRAYSLGRFESEADTRQWVETMLEDISDDIVVTTNLNDEVITTVVTVPAADLMATGLIGTFSDITVTVASSQFKEV